MSENVTTPSQLKFLIVTLWVHKLNLKPRLTSQHNLLPLKISFPRHSLNSSAFAQARHHIKIIKMATIDSESMVPAREFTALKPAADIVIGHAQPSEAAAIAKMGADTFTATFGFSVSAEDLATFLNQIYIESAILADLKDPAIETWSARDSTGRVLGMVQLVRGLTEPCVPGDPATHAELRRLYVDTAAHGRGIGSKLIAAVEEQARAEGFKELWLTVWENNNSAERLYLRLGYQKVGATDFLTGECVQTDYVLSKSL
ncbi:acyl-CoA N-acyltransferase [Xylaria acuta]|nr:acyl-CoA N-acyltransferase [Xylaria acuta]